jgi:hypothetical protein
VILSRKNPEPPATGVADAWLDLLPALEIHGYDAAGALVSWPASGAVETPLLRLGGSVRPLLPGRLPRFGRAIEPGARIDANEPWARAAALQLAQQDHDRAPGDAGVNMKELVTSSRESGVMLPSTSYIVVENAAQWRMLDVSERQKLDQNAALDFKETPAPAWVWLSAGFAAWLALRHSRASRVTE